MLERTSSESGAAVPGCAQPARPRFRTSPRGDRGVAAVEFALVLPLLLLMVFGTVDFGYLVNRNTMVNNATREGAREAIFNPDVAAIEARVRSVTPTLDQTQLTVDVDCRDALGVACPGISFDSEWEPGGSVIVTVDYVHDFLTPAPNFVGMGSTKTVSSVIEMRIEG
jgi:TadE-like protein